MEDRIMYQLQRRALEQAEQQGRFCIQRTQFYIVTIRKDNVTSNSSTAPTDEQGGPTGNSAFTDWKKAFRQSRYQDTGKQSTLNCVFQHTRPAHLSGQPDYLPFANRSEMQDVFDTLRLPPSYFQIVNGTAGSAQSHTFEKDGQVRSYEFIAHCLSKQGDWALALSHDAKDRVTSAFWSVEDKIDSASLLDNFHSFQRYASHPMLIPCIMFAENLRMSEDRRHAIKSTLQKLEDAITRISQKEAASYDHASQTKSQYRQPQDLEIYFQMLHKCRKDQSSRKGRYGFWRSFIEAVDNGFEYIEKILTESPDPDLQDAHEELKRWIAINDNKLDSLMSRDEDHVYRVDNVSHMLYSLVEQRDLRVQSSIARAAQHDSEDMKFIAVLGSIFLPASLIATILNVPEFQFATGTTLFAAYIGMTVPLIGVVVLLCFARPQLKRWPRWALRVDKLQGRQHTRQSSTQVWSTTMAERNDSA